MRSGYCYTIFFTFIPRSIQYSYVVNSKFSCLASMHRSKLFPNVTPAQWSKLDNLHEQILHWNSKVNLISRKDTSNLFFRHMLPCLSISHVCSFDSADDVIDVGTGGGFPGLPLAIIFPETSFTLLDGNKNKMNVLSEIVQFLKVSNVKIVNDRSENIKQKYTYVLGRGVS